jgi:two-component system, sensor histidine kinase
VSDTGLPVRSRRHDAILRQGERLQTDLISRELSVAFVCALYALFLPLTVVTAVYAICVVSEAIQFLAFRRYRTRPTGLLDAIILANAHIALAAFSLLGLLLWHHDEPFIQLGAVMSLVGALLNVSSARAADLWHGILSGIPPVAALLWLSGQSVAGAHSASGAVFATVCVVVFVGYFGSALVQNHQVQNSLARAGERANAANAAKSRFLAAMSHQMRTPLNAILGLSQSLPDATDRSAIETHAAEIESAARQLETLVADVLDLAAAEEGTLAARAVTASVRRELASALQTCRSGRAAQPVITVAPDVPEFARFDPRHLRKIVAHLADMLGFPDDMSPPAAVTVVCTLAPGPAFDIRFDAAPLDPAGGSPGVAHTTPDGSLALALVNRLAALLDAQVRFAPEGAAAPVHATLTLPFDAVPDLPAPGSVAPDKRLRILVVDDIATNRFVVSQLLRSLDSDASEADSGKAALAAMARDRFDLVLLDMNMPVMDGEATFRAIRASGHALPVIALTADALAEHRERYLAMGLDGYVPKPVDKRLLWAEISAALA